MRYVLQVSSLLADERQDTVRDALISLWNNVQPFDGPLAVIRTNPAPCFMVLGNDPVLHDHRIVLEIGRVKNRNKNTCCGYLDPELTNSLSWIVSPWDVD